MAYGDLKVRNLIWNTGSGDNTVVLSTLATQSYVTTNFAPKANPTFTGTVTVPTAPASDVSTKAASTAFVDAYYATKASPTFTGSPTVPGYAALAGAAFTGAVTGTDLTLSGNLVVNGTTTTINTQTLDVEDINITLGKVSTPSDTTANNGGITLKGSNDKTFNWLNATDAWTSSEHIEIVSGKAFRVNGNNVLNQTTLGSTVVSSSLTSLGTLTGLTVAGDMTLDNGTNAGKDITWDESANSLIFANEVKAQFGQTTLFHNSTDLYVQNGVGDIRLEPKSGEPGLWLHRDGSVELYDGNAAGVAVKKFETTATGVNVTGQITVNGSPLSSAPTVDLVADGAIAANKPVAVQSDGKIKEIKETISVLGTPVKHGIDWDPSSRSQYVDAVYVPDEQVVVMVFNNDNNYDYGYVTVFSCNSSGTVTRGNSIQLNNSQSTQATSWHRVTWDSTAKRIVCSYKQGGPFASSSQPRYDTFTVSGLTLTRTAYQQQIHYGSNTNSYHWLGYDPDTQFFIFAVKYDQSNYAYKGYLMRFKIDSSNAKTDFSTSGGRYGPDGDYGVSSETEVDYPAHVMGSNSMIYTIYRSTNNSNKGFVCVKQIQSNGSWYLTTAPRVEIESSQVDSGMAIGYDPDTNKCLAVWSLMSGAVKCCVVSVSGTGTNATLSKGTTITLSSYGLWQSCEYDKTINKMVVKYQNGSQFPCIRYVTISGTTAIAGNELVLYNTAGTNAGDLVDHGVYSLAHFENVGKMTGWFAADSNRTLENVPFYGGTAVSTLSNGYIGISSAAINDTATGTIAVTGNTNASQSGLTAGAKHYVQKDGSLKTTPEPTLTVEAGIALSSTKLLIK